ncbi:RNA polymerase sigma factor [Streptosporangium amethystogenes]|uniref:RNA polymerase sigma factor n=1 Tax=Streptosporangium amethystogenes TaxID=2002 RepID=UPI0004C8625A|nr:RNA polymerase sigma factor [Streptosporangium amethystogenes]
MKDHYRYFFKALMAIGATEEQAHETIGEVTADMMQKQSWDRLKNPKAWIRKAVRHTYYSSRQRERERPNREIKGCFVTPDSYIDHGLNVWEDEQWVKQMLDALPETQRAVAALIFDDHKHSEIAELLGRSPDAIRQNLAHARKRLKANLGKDYRIDPASRPAPAPQEEDTL